MPTIAVDKADLYKALGQEYTTDEFQELCFRFGIELDEDTTDHCGEERPQLKIEIPANRYDMLCFEGIALMLNVFNGKTSFPEYKLVTPSSGKLEMIVVDEDTAGVRPYVSGAILRGVTFTPENYSSFIALQDKLHQNLARHRTLVAIGTHDLSTIKGPFKYAAKIPKDIKFVPLDKKHEMDGEQLMEFYATDPKSKHIAKYLPIIRDKPLYPVIYDSQQIVCSLPPIINGDHSKITLETKDVLIEMTGTDRTKLEIVNNIMIAMFSVYCSTPFEVEPVQIISQHNGEGRITPDISPRKTVAEVDYMNACTGLNISPEEICKLLSKMGLKATPSMEDKNLIDVSVPPTRADILHQADIMEDLGIAYGFDSLPKSNPTRSATIAQPLPINKLGDIVRLESAMAGWTEVMPLVLCSHDEAFSWMNKIDDGNTCVKLENPKTAEYQIVRTSLLPGLLKTIRENKKHSVPIKIFEVADVTFKDESLERKARNEKHFGAAWYGKSSGFEVVHGLLDRVLLMLKTAFLTHEEGLSGKKLESQVKKDPTKLDGYWIEEIDEPTFFAGHAAAIYLRLNGKTQRIGEFGILHPTVLEKFELRYPVSTIEINLEVFL